MIKVRVCSDSVLCLEKCQIMWNQIKSKMGRSSKRFLTVRFLQGIIWKWCRTDWVRVNFSQDSRIGNPPENPEYLQDQNIEPETFTDRIIFMSMFNDTEWTRRGNSEQCISNSEQVKEYAKRFSRGHWTFLGPGSELNMVWNSKLSSWRKMGIHCSPDGDAIRGIGSSSIWEHQRFESWNSEEEE